jgi:hypothetical protein
MSKLCVVSLAVRSQSVQQGSCSEKGNSQQRCEAMNMESEEAITKQTTGEDIED